MNTAKDRREAIAKLIAVANSIEFQLQRGSFNSSCTQSEREAIKLARWAALAAITAIQQEADRDVPPRTCEGFLPPTVDDLRAEGFIYVDRAIERLGA